MRNTRPRTGRSILAAGKLVLEGCQFGKRRVRIDRWLALTRRAAGVGPMRRSGIGTPLPTALAETLHATLVLIPVPSLALEALARRASLAFARLALTARGRVFGWCAGRLPPSVSPVPLASLRSLGPLSVRRRRLRAIRFRLLPAIPVAIVARTSIGGSPARPPDLDHRRLTVRLRRRSVSRGNRG